MIKMDHSPYTFWLEDGRMPEMLNLYAKSAKLYDEIDVKQDARGDWCFVGVSRDDEMPFLAITMRYAPSQAGFSPGILLVPETNTLFIGAGERVLGYNLQAVRRVVYDKVDAGFWGWKLHGDVVVMSAELEIAAWSSDGSFIPRDLVTVRIIV